MTTTRRRRGNWGVRALVILSVVSLPSAALSVITGGVDVELGGSATQAIAVNPTNSLNVACASQAQLRVSTDGGATWQPPVYTAGPVSHLNHGRPSLAFDSQGRLFWSFQAWLTSGANVLDFHSDIVVARCDPNTGAILPGYPVNVTVQAGVGFESPNRQYSVLGKLSADRFDSSPFTDTLYMVWYHLYACCPSTSRSILLSRSTDQGLTWSLALPLGTVTSSFNKWPAQVTVAPNGDVYVAVHFQPGFDFGNIVPDGVSGRVKVFRSTDGGASFPQNTTAYPGGFADMTWNIRPSNGSWEISIIPGTDFVTKGSALPWILADPNTPGRIYVIANDDPDNNITAGDAADVYIVTSTDHGATWSFPPTRIDSGPGSTFQVMPAAAIDGESGEIVVTYYDNRNGNLNADGNFLLDTFVTVSRDGGQTFTADMQVNDVSFDPDAGADRPSDYWGSANGKSPLGVWGSAADSVFAVGAGGTILYYDGSSWSSQDSGTGAELTGVWGSSASDVFAAGVTQNNGSIFHYDGVSWSTQFTGGHVLDVWGNSPSDVFAVGGSGRILHYDGISWSPQASGTLQELIGVWGSSGSDVFAVGKGGTILHYNGSSWSPLFSGTQLILMDVWGAAADDVFAVGYSGAIFHYNGSVWSAMDGGTGVSLFGVWGTTGSDVFAVGLLGTILHYDGSSWSSMESGAEYSLYCAWGASGTDVWSGGLHTDDILHYDGSSWSSQRSPVADPIRNGIGSYSGVAVGGGKVYAVWTGNTTDGLGDALDQQTIFDTFDVAPPFTEVTLGAVADSAKSVSASWIDLDGDADLDVFLGGGSLTPNAFWRNDGGDVFVRTASPLAGDSVSTQGVAWADLDGDGMQEVYLANVDSPNQLLSPGGIELGGAPIDLNQVSTGASWVDFDSDGQLDLYVAASDELNRLFRATDVGFVDETPTALNGTGWSEGARWADWDSDGDVDCYVAMVGLANVLVRNDGAFGFVDVTPAAMADPGQGQGIAWGDYDNDGDVDLYLCNFDGPNRLFENQGGGAFVDVTSAALANPGHGQSGVWGDYDNDGDLDIFLTNNGEADQLMRNDGGGAFVEVWNFPGSAAEPSIGAAWGDYDEDGDLDLVVANYAGPSHVYRNDLANGNHFLHVSVKGSGITNYSAIGVRVRVTTTSGTQMREIGANNGFWSHGSFDVEFGLGSATTVDEVEIRWSRGPLTVLTGVAADTRITVVEDTTWAVSAGTFAPGAPTRSLLYPASPNPFGRSTKIQFDLARAGRTELRIFNVAGRLVRVLVSEDLPAGRYEEAWNGRTERGRAAVPGVYFYRLSSGTYEEARSLVLLR